MEATLQNESRLDLKGAMAKYIIASITSVSSLCPVLMAGTFMLGRGVSPSLVGIVMSAGNLLTVVMQPRIASTADKHDGPTLTQMAQWLAIGSSIFALLSLLISGEIATAVFMVGLFMCFKNISGLTNSVSVYYQNRGADMNYGLARGIGSAAYAVVSAVLGNLIASQGTDVIMMVGIALFMLYVVTIGLLPTPKDVPAITEERSKGAKGAAEEDGGGYLDFLMSHKRFILLVIGCSLIYASMSPFQTYAILIVQGVGGDAADMGNILAVSAMAEIPAMFISKWLDKKFGTSRLLRFSLFGFMLKALAITLSTSVPMLYVAYSIQCIGQALYIPTSVSYGNKRFSEGDKNKAIGLLGIVGMIGGVVGSPLVGFLSDTIGVAAMLKVITGLSVVGFVFAFAGVEMNLEGESGAEAA